ncbi:MAG: lysophospholipid acyltransferase family protein [Armatimonadota bacterium]
MHYFISTRTCSLVIRLFGGIKVIGRENIPKTGGIILAPNHISHVDPPAVTMAVPRQVHFMAKEELFKVPVIGWVLTKSGSFPVRRGSADRKAIKNALNLLAEGKVLCLFPEGKRSADGNLQDPEIGLGMIALKAGVPVIPVAIIGSNKMLPKNAKMLKRHRITMIFGKPITFDDLGESRETRTGMEEVGKRVMSAIADLQSSHSE